MSSLLHQTVQKHIYKLLPEGEGALEHRLPGHVVDLVWVTKKIAFEVQCSPISVETAVKRTKDLENLGLFVVWILHQKSFNTPSPGTAELFLRKRPTSYYTNLSTTGHGYIYDQTERFRNNERRDRSPPLIVDLTQPKIRWSSLSFKGDRNQLENWLKYFLKKIK